MSEAKLDFAARLNQAFDRLGIPARQHGRFTALSRLFGVSAVAARDWCEGKSYPSVDKLLVIMDTVRCGADWLLFGRATAGVAAAGATPGTGKAAEPAAAAEAWIEVGSDAMAPTVQRGDAVRLAPEEGAPLEDGLHAVALDGAAAAGDIRIRRLSRRLDGSLELCCDNPLYAERVRCREVEPGKLLAQLPDAPALRVVGRVIEIRRLLR